MHEERPTSPGAAQHDKVAVRKPMLSTSARHFVTYAADYRRLTRPPTMSFGITTADAEGIVRVLVGVQL